MTSPIPPLRSRSTSERGIRRDTLATVPVSSGISTLTVTLLSLGAFIAWWFPGSQWSSCVVVGIAAILLAAGWPTLARLHMPWVAQGVLIAAGILTPVAVAYWRNLDIAIPLTGIALSALVAATILDAPAPRDHSVGHTREHWGSTALSAALASAVTGLLIVTSGSMWVALTVLERWSVTVPLAALVCLASTMAVRAGNSVRGGVILASITGILVGLTAAGGAWLIGQSADLAPIVFPFIGRRFGELAAFLTLGGVTGGGVGFSVSVVDALLGDRRPTMPLAAALGRGAAKFLAAALPVYAMIRIGGI